MIRTLQDHTLGSTNGLNCKFSVTSLKEPCYLFTKYFTLPHPPPYNVGIFFFTPAQHRKGVGVGEWIFLGVFVRIIEFIFVLLLSTQCNIYTVTTDSGGLLIFFA